MSNFLENNTDVKQDTAVCLRMITMKKSELHTVRQVITANWLIALCTWLVEIIRKVVTINKSAKIIHNPYLKA
jgi:hypothetical protein